MAIQSKANRPNAAASLGLSSASSIALETHGHPIVPAAGARTSVTSSLLATKSTHYIMTVLGIALAICLYHIRAHGIFGCQATLYSSDRYLSYCNTTRYGDYDHGAMWFGLEPVAAAAAANAHVLFVGNSRTQFAFSSPATEEWFSATSESYYLLGFSHEENYTFEGPLLRRLRPRAKVYVINIDTFFDQLETAPGKTVMHSESAKTDYETKERWQHIQKAVCTTLKPLCGSDETIFRSRSTGAWVVIGNKFPSEPVSYDDNVDANKVASYRALGGKFLPGLTADPACTILTVVPTVKTGIATAQAVAADVGFRLVAPKLPGLATFDRMHLDSPSAQRWSSAFFSSAGSQIRKCLSR
jgi:hypothetical protein